VTVDLAGQTFGRLEVLAAVPGPWPERSGWWQTRCSCGHQVVTPGDGLRNGRVRSCHDCIARDQAEAAAARRAAYEVLGWRGTSWRP
jgi:hypothetical protein